MGVSGDNPLVSLGARMFDARLTRRRRSRRPTTRKARIRGPFVSSGAGFEPATFSYAPDGRTTAPAVRCASAMIETIGFTPGAVGNALASPIQTPETSCSSPRPSATDVSGSDPIRHAPI